MILGVIGGIRGNFPALEAVLRDLDEEGIERVACTGDLVAGYPWPNEVIAELRRRAVPCVRGEADRQVVRFLRKDASLRRRHEAEDIVALQYAFEALDSGNLEFLRGLPKSNLLTIDGVEVMLCHGTPGNPAEILHPEDNDQRYFRQREVSPAPIIVHGGTDAPHVRRVANTLFVNPGSLGTDAARAGHASYAIVSTEDEPWDAEIRSVPYDAATAREARNAALERPML